ncbi:MAG: hypothetical protein ACHQZR_06855 [Candidatus Limnocylindrales bacterium]
MSHPALGLPPLDHRAGLPEAARRLRAARTRLAATGLQAAVKQDPTLTERHDELALRELLRDADRHLEQLAQAMETGQPHLVTTYAEWVQPAYRRRHVPAGDQAALLRGLADAASTVLSPSETEALAGYVMAWLQVLEFHRRLPGDHKGNAAARFIWKGAGILDDSII